MCMKAAEKNIADGLSLREEDPTKKYGMKKIGVKMSKGKQMKEEKCQRVSGRVLTEGSYQDNVSAGLTGFELQRTSLR